jgi:6-phosphogluconolactonase
MVYGAEVGSATIDICLIELAACGEIAGILSHQLLPGPNPVVAISDTDPQKLVMSPAQLSAAKEIWILASGSSTAEYVLRASTSEPSPAAAYLTGLEHATWMVDQDAASLLPFHECRL